MKSADMKSTVPIKKFLSNNEVDRLRGNKFRSEELFKSLYDFKTKAILELQNIADKDVKYFLHKANAHDFPSTVRDKIKDWKPVKMDIVDTDIYMLEFTNVTGMVKNIYLLESGLPHNEFLSTGRHLTASYYRWDESPGTEGREHATTSEQKELVKEIIKTGR